jgi:hypothetical protein
MMKDVWDDDAMEERMADAGSAAGALERRRHERFSPARRVSIACIEGAMSVFGWGQAHPSPSLLDLSSGGVRLATHEPLRAGSVLRLELETDGMESVEAFGEVRWSRRGGNQYQSGIEFFALEGGREEEMRNFFDLVRRPARNPG